MAALKSHGRMMLARLASVSRHKAQGCGLPARVAESVRVLRRAVG